MMPRFGGVGIITLTVRTVKLPQKKPFQYISIKTRVCHLISSIYSGNQGRLDQELVSNFTEILQPQHYINFDVIHNPFFQK